MTRYFDPDRAGDAPDLNDLAELYGDPTPAQVSCHEREDFYADLGGPAFYDDIDFDF